MLNAFDAATTISDGRGRVRKEDRFAWTDERVAILRSRIAAGSSCAQVGAEIGCSRNAVIGKKARLGIVSPLSNGQLRARAEPRRIVTKQRRNQIVISRVAVKARPIPQPVAPSLEFKISLFDLENQHCRYPLWDAETEPKFYCGSPTADLLEGRSYCPFHHRRVYQRDAR